MKKLDQAPEIHAIAQSLELSTEGGAVGNIIHHCHQRIQGWLKDSRAIRSIHELEQLVCHKLRLVIEEVWSDEELNAACDKYLKQGETIFAHVRNDFDDKTFATLVERKKISPKSVDRYVAIVDCRGQKGLRRFFTRWHEIAHILTLNQQLELRLHRTSASTEQNPSEKLMDAIAAEVGFYKPLFGPIFKEELARAGRLTFGVIDKVRERFSSEASFAATLHACLKECAQPAALLDCGMGYKKGERDQLESKQGLLIPEKIPSSKLRLLTVVPNVASKGHFNFHKNMAIPATSLIQDCHSGKCDETLQYARNESLQIWRHSDGTCLGFGSVHVEVRKMGDRVHALVTGL
jgi:hypothetical protein